MFMPFRLGVIGVLLLILSLGSVSQVPTPPAQPDSGPGGKQAPHAAVIKNRYGQGGKEYWIYEPDRPKPTTAPVVVFIHGWGGTNPLYYGAWIDHLVKRGNIVIFPRYQSSILTRREDFIPNTLDAIKDGIQRLQTERGHVRPDFSKFATVGHFTWWITVSKCRRPGCREWTSTCSRRDVCRTRINTPSGKRTYC
jgi:acetyl esterase/lipase